MAAVASFSVVAPVARLNVSKVSRKSAVAPLMKSKSVSLSISSRRGLIVRASDMSNKIDEAISEAKETCDDGKANECAAAWDTVEELSAEAAHQKAKAVPLDPMEEYCKEAPDADECRVYED
mmetsp:Transcript_6804/g.9221  ORF Transcript_6804/g.9221 Transcript_6804/m.9221 type:complete len:122 (+) Transcript_6804:106-471(+)|eukprot:CAMPEP_0196579292 /NCGR_PEP_ID=MMETSP1081-20130531/19837_1 /TAXON_ID=36882 /ORGANISM="Pyramimonas amylifera, Strain CCMP720" /LENGTH=121 /DNA_ID=CAMNT_0041898825 /DNA_START=96 /DNA_END=461 /DNA_ORIENTATION=-